MEKILISLLISGAVTFVIVILIVLQDIKDNPKKYNDTNYDETKVSKYPKPVVIGIFLVIFILTYKLL